MKQLKSYRIGQQRWSHKGETYSIIDQWAWPDKREGVPQDMIDRFETAMSSGMSPNERIEVALQLKENDPRSETYTNFFTGKQEQSRVKVLGRYATFEEALADIKAGTALDRQSFWS